MPGAALAGDAVAGARLVLHHAAGEGGAHGGGAVAGGRGHQRGQPDGRAVEGVLKDWMLTQQIPYIAIPGGRAW